ncbi:MAG TPA: phosphohydrolase [Deltaproteobacteria bacterium]|nr:phosphohydrolase [Deltaproteobacteria bacterium]
MDPLEILSKYYDPESTLFDVLLEHGRRVAGKAIDAAKRVTHLKPDLEFIQEASMLHDIGIFLTRTSSLGCEGDYPYVCHGYLGRELLEKRGFGRHALVCERHLGVGLTAEDIEKESLPLPVRDMVPVSIEELIISYADKFYSKSNGSAEGEKSVEAIKSGLLKFGQEKVERFVIWHRFLEF